MEFKHTSVLLHETIDNLNIRPDGIYVDGTLGGAGHSSEIVKRLNENGRLIGIDQDEDAIAAASERLKDYSDKVTIIRSNYCNMKEELNRIGVTKVNGILLDLGVSSFQLDTPERGFTYREEDAPLDMRMDQRQTLTAKDIVNDYSESELYRIIRTEAFAFYDRASGYILTQPGEYQIFVGSSSANEDLQELTVKLK